jgi:hypothetical protein
VNEQALQDAYALYAVKVADVVTPLQPHQQRVLDKLRASNGLLVAHGVGSGKTLTSIAAGEDADLPLDVVTPASLQANFQKEMDKHLSEPLAHDVRIRSYEKAVRGGEDAIDKSRFAIFDEAHRGRNPGTGVSKLLRQAREAEKRLLLTGTAVYNQPQDIAPLLNTAIGDKVLPEDGYEFKNRFVGEKVVQPSTWNRLRGMKPMTVPVLKNRDELINAATGYIDVHQGGGGEFPERINEDVDVPMSPKQHQYYRHFEGTMPWYLRAKIRAGLPMNKQESQELNAFQGALRQVSNTPRPYNAAMTDDEEHQHTPKIQRMADDIQKMHAKDPNYRGVAYSNYLDGGLLPLSRALQKRNIPHEIFHGGVSKQDRARMVADYNAGKNKVLLVSSSGSEGLDLKGTKSVSVMEPHWNDSKIEQVIGRGIRYKSHAHLPENERKVVVRRYYSGLPKGPFGIGGGDKAIERYLKSTADQKMGLGKEIMEAMQEASDRGPLKQPSQSPGVMNGPPAEAAHQDGYGTDQPGRGG